MSSRISKAPLYALAAFAIFGVVLWAVVRHIQDQSIFQIVNPVTFESLPHEKRPQKVLMLNTTSNPDGQMIANTVLIYEDGQREKCTYRMRLEPASGGVTVTPQSRICGPVTEAN